LIGIVESQSTTTAATTATTTATAATTIATTATNIATTATNIATTAATAATTTAATAATAATSPATALYEYDCIYSDEILIHSDGNVFMSNYVNIDEGTFTIRIRYTNGYSWIGIGINFDDKSKMSPAYAIIGANDINHNGVQSYNLISDDKAGSGVIPLLLQDQDNNNNNGQLKPGSFFIQRETDLLVKESVLEFTHNLIIRNNANDPSSIIEHEINESSVWIWAVGLPDNVWEGKVSVNAVHVMDCIDCIDCIDIIDIIVIQ
jgi:hypothetical protein